ncbi:MAG TPA: DUF6398 domain-containing protein [Chloroflexota bacterium]|nr:DUF6398 domain-containing protein [Chloroflexota bacterium]
MTTERRESIPLKLRPLYDAIVARTDAFCQEYLTDEYAELCRKLAAALARKRPSPLTQGRIETWACAIVYVIGSVNFLFDKSQTPHMTGAELSERFGVANSTASNKASAIRKMFRIYPLDPDWCLPSKLGDNPLVWMLSVNGLPVDARYAPRWLQAEALRKGLIPYIP